MGHLLNRSVAGLVLAAGGSSRLGQPKQTLPYDGTTLLGRVLDNARSCGFDQLLVTLGGAAGHVLTNVDSPAPVSCTTRNTRRGARRRSPPRCRPSTRAVTSW